jgi:hypothetical protein
MDEVPNLVADTNVDNQSTKQEASQPDPVLSAIEKGVGDAAKGVNGVWIAFISLCVYIFIATYTVTPATLFRDAKVKLPIFSADLPLKIYFVMAPVLLLTAHVYLIVLTRGLSERIEDIWSRSSKMSTRGVRRRAIRARVNNSIIMGAVSERYGETYRGVAGATGFIAGVTMTALPIMLLLLTQLIFLPYQEEWVTWVHRGFIFADILVCCWLLLPSTGPATVLGRGLVVALTVLVFATSFLFAVFPGELIYTKLEGHWPHAFTDKMFEGSPDPVDYVSNGGVLPFPNRLILPDDPKLADVAGTASDGVSLSMRGRNFRKAVFDRSNLARVDFSAADLDGASLRGARLEGSKFDCAGSAIVPFHAPIGGFYSTDNPTGKLVCAKLNGANLAYAHLDGASFEGAQLSGSALNDTTITGTNFSRSTLLGAQLSRAVGRGPKFRLAQLIAVDFRHAQLFGADFERASLQGASLANSYLQAASFRGSRMQGVDASRASLQGASFEETFLQAATFFGASIQGVSFKEAALVPGIRAE